MTRLADMRCLFVDAQTTGPTPAAGRLLELGWCVDAAAGPGGLALATLEGALVRPEGEVPRRILKLTGRTLEELAAGADLADVYERLQRALATHRPGALVAHYARFEAPFLAELWKECGGEELALPLLCTHEICRRLYPDLPSRSLRAVAGYFGLGLGELKHATAHAQATAHIWRHLVPALAEREGVTTLGGLQAWLSRKAPGRSGARAWPLEKERRLGLPDVPGVYRMLAADGRILYVGKATSLRSRVNSYFRQRRGHPPAKLELLTQVVDIETIPCATAVEAALLETDEIKRHDPPYNVVMREGSRALGFYDRSLAPADHGAWQFGPFSHQGELTPLWVLAAALAVLRGPGAGPLDPQELVAPLIHGDGPSDVLLAGLTTFAALAGSPPGATPRALLARGIQLARQAAADESGDDEEEPEAAPSDDEDSLTLTADAVASQLVSLLIAAGRSYLRARRVRRLLNADVVWRPPGAPSWRWLVVRGGLVRAAGDAARPEADLEVQPSLPPAERLDISTYDRMRVLDSETRRVARDGAELVVRYLGHKGNPWL